MRLPLRIRTGRGATDDRTSVAAQGCRRTAPFTHTAPVPHRCSGITSKGFSRDIFFRSPGAWALAASALLAACGGGGSKPSAPPPAVPEPLERTILHIDDHHSHMASIGRTLQPDGLNAVYANGTSGSYPYTGGLRFDVDATRPTGSRASGLEVYDTATARWVALDPARSYRLVVPSYNAAGGDGYTSLGNLPVARREDIGLLDADLFQTWIERQPKDPVRGLPLLRRLDDSLYSTRRYLQP